MKLIYKMGKSANYYNKRISKNVVFNSGGSQTHDRKVQIR
jgi:hypothetical protein